MLLQLTSRRLAGSIFSVLFLVSINSGVAEAQIIPDGTLPTNVEQLENMQKITGGERSGNNLFHSFEEFAIPAGMEVIFENATDIQNIFTRITGSEASFIDGLLQTTGGANFFLINPNGIIFGENAQLNVGGSFIATTANSIEFADGTSFIASGDEPKVTLTISLPIGLGLYGNNGSITVNGTGNQITNDSTFAPIEFGQKPTGISAPNGQTIGLLGNGIDFNSGVVTTEGGNIYISSIESGSVGISQAENGLTLLVTSVNNYQDINLNQQSLIDASGDKVGNIFLSGKNINLNEASFILSQNQGSLSGGSINIRASESINITGNPSPGAIDSAIHSQTLNSGKGANINISSNQLVIQNQGRIQSSTFSDNVGGNLDIAVANDIQLKIGAISALSAGAGNAGNISLSSSQLLLSDRGILTSSTLGKGNAGEVNIDSDLIEVIGGSSTSTNRSNISSASFSPGNTGNLTINTEQLLVKDGGSISTSSASTGNAGNIIIKASESVEVSGKDQKFQGSDTPQSTIKTSIQAASPAGQQRFGLPAVPSGDSGSLTINTPSLRLFEEGVISVENQGRGSAGTLSINADNLNLDQTGRITAAASSGLGGEIFLNSQNLKISNDSQITATAGGEGEGGNITINTTNLTAKKNNNITASANLGEGGNITINADSLSLNERDSIATESNSADGGNIILTTDQLQLDNNSQISTSAQGEGNGGNITINTDIFTALDNSRVTAEAIEGNGGNITINTEGYFVSDDFVIDASSEFGLDGVITINAPENDLQKDLKLFNLNFSAPDEALVSSCSSPNRERGRFLLGGGSGFALSSDRYYSQTDLILEFKKSPQTPNEETLPEEEISPQDTSWQKGDPIIPADKIVYTPDGRAFLVASSPQAKDLSCQAK